MVPGDVPCQGVPYVPAGAPSAPPAAHAATARVCRASVVFKSYLTALADQPAEASVARERIY